MLPVNSFLKLIGTMFFIIGLVHLLRLLTGFEIILGGWPVPLWISVLGVLIPWYFSYTAFTLSNKKNKS